MEINICSTCDYIICEDVHYGVNYNCKILENLSVQL